MPIKKKKPRIEVSLPDAKSVPVSDLQGYAMLLFGKKKIGKTSLCQHFNKTLFLFFERGGKALSIYQRHVPTWIHFKKYVELVVSSSKFNTIVIDPADIAYDLCLQYVCTKLCITHPSEEGWGKGWNAVKTEFNKEFKKLLDSGKGIIFISHQKIEEIETRSGQKFNRVTNTMSGQAREALEGPVDIWANYDYDGEKRVLTIMGDDYIDAGHRLNEDPSPRFLYTDGTPIKKIPMGNSSKEAYANLIKAFNNQLRKEVPAPVKKKVAIRKKLK